MRGVPVDCVVFPKLSSLLGIRNDLMELHCYAGLSSVFGTNIRTNFECSYDGYHILMVCLFPVRFFSFLSI